MITNRYNTSLKLWGKRLVRDERTLATTNEFGEIKKSMVQCNNKKWHNKTNIQFRNRRIYHLFKSHM